MESNREPRVALFALSFLPLFFLIGACTQKSVGKVAPVSPLEVMGLLRNDFAVLVDVRDPAELKETVAEPARLIAFSKIEKREAEWTSFLQEVPKSKQIVFCCGKESEVAQAATYAAQAGYSAGIMGTVDEWVEAGLPLKKR